MRSLGLSGVTELVPMLTTSSGPQSKAVRSSCTHDSGGVSSSTSCTFWCSLSIFRLSVSVISLDLFVLVSKFFSIPEVTTGTHSPFHKQSTFTTCTLSLPAGFFLALLSLFLPNPSQRILHATSDNASRPSTMTSTLHWDIPLQLPHPLALWWHLTSLCHQYS